METELSKYIRSEVIEVLRSAIHFASYNPRIIAEENRKNLKRGIKRYGLLGGIVVNKRTGMTIVGGHQKVKILDDLHKYNPQTKENDYKLRVEVVDVDEKTEMEENILLNNPNAQGTWDRDKLAEMIPHIEYKDTGLNEADLSLLGLDHLFKTVEENNLANSLDDLMKEVEEENEVEKESKIGRASCRERV